MFQKKNQKVFQSQLDFNATPSKQNYYYYNNNQNKSTQQSKFLRPTDNKTELFQTNYDSSNYNYFRDGENQVSQLANSKNYTTNSLDSNTFEKSKKTQFETQPPCQLDLRESGITAYRELSMNTSSSNICFNNFLSNNASMKESREDSLVRENINLKRENQSLKQEVEKLRRLDGNSQQIMRQRNKVFKLQKQKEELEKQIQRIQRDSEKKTELSVKQNKLYKQIIEKLEKRIEVLLQQNSQLNETIKKSFIKLKEMEFVQEKIEQIKNQYSKLEYIVQEDNMQWQRHKQIWINEKEYYKEIIRKLEFQLKIKSEY